MFLLSFMRYKRPNTRLLKTTAAICFAHKLAAWAGFGRTAYLCPRWCPGRLRREGDPPARSQPARGCAASSSAVGLAVAGVGFLLIQRLVHEGEHPRKQCSQRQEAGASFPKAWTPHRLTFVLHWLSGHRGRIWEQGTQNSALDRTGSANSCGACYPDRGVLLFLTDEVSLLQREKSVETWRQ